MSFFASQFAAHAVPGLFEMHAESVVYTPAGGTGRAIRAIVHRTGPREASMGQPNAGRVAPVIRVTVRDDSSCGVSRDEIDVDGDTITLDGEDRARRIVKPSPAAQSSGMLVLEIRS